MAKPARGLPSDFNLDLPDESPVLIGDFLDEEPLPLPRREEPRPSKVTEPTLRPAIAPVREEREVIQTSRAPRRSQPKVVRYQLNLTPKAKRMLEELVEHVRTYSPESDARTSEVFQGIIGLLHNAMGELNLSELPRRGAWGSVTAKNFPGALSEEFERAILRAAKRPGREQ